MKIIDDIFIKHKLDKLKTPVRTLDMKDMRDINSVLILWPHSLKSLKIFTNVTESIAQHYNVQPVVMTPVYYNLYSKIQKKNIYDIDMPRATKFQELERIERIAKAMKHIDLYYDFSSYDIRIRAMIRRILKPDIAISFKEGNMEDDYNILVSADNNPLKLLSMTGVEIGASDTADMLKKMKKRAKYSIYDNIVIGQSFSMRRRAEQLMKSAESVLYIDDLKTRMDDKMLFAISDAPNIIADDSNRAKAGFIRELLK